jgi:hypothetical protein
VSDASYVVRAGSVRVVLQMHPVLCGSGAVGGRVGCQLDPIETLLASVPLGQRCGEGRFFQG